MGILGIAVLREEAVSGLCNNAPDLPLDRFVPSSYLVHVFNK
jgi:hypothetical protein